MGSVQRDVAQLVSGRWDYPFGGQAWLASLCGSNAYSVVGYALGSFPEPAVPSVYHYDIFVTAHELGHNAGAAHTQDYGIDTCHIADTEPRRGSIMSYCTQTWSGGNANGDNRFHTTVQPNIESHVAESSCVVDDCNRNGIDDTIDIQQATSPDTDGNGIPDECEDCNGNGVLDDEDISLGTSLDLNANGIPDECEPDCDSNNIPDDKQIADGLSTDLHGDGVPDECEADCNLNLISDYTEIQVDMTLDVDRDATLDACQDCDTDGTPDLSELGGGHSLWITSGLADSDVRQFHPVTGVLMQVSQGGGGALVGQGRDLIATSAGRVLVTSASDSTVKEYDRNGNFAGNLVGSGSGGLANPGGLLMTAGGTLLVASRDTDAVLEYDGSTGAPLGSLVGSGSSPLVSPFGMTIGPDGRLYVTSSANEVLRYDLADGAYLDTFVTASANGGLDSPRGLVFKPDGNLLVASFGTDEVLEYEGATGAPLGKWAQVGTATRLTQTSPWGIRVGPNGNVFVARTGEDFGSGSLGSHDHSDEESDIVEELHLTDARTYEYDVRTGGFIRAHVTGQDHNLRFAAGFDFVPGWAVDCNFNLIQDSCDITTGTSQDTDASGVPDECEIDCNANGTLDRLDIIPFGTSLDCNHNLTPDECDLSSGASDDCTQNGVPDECEADCNRNGIADSCELQAGTSTDCDANGVPDECDAVIDFEAGSGWFAGAPGDTATAGTWVRVNPVGTAAQPEYDHTPGAGRTCWVTGQGTVGGALDAADVDGGKTTLTSTAIDLAGHSDPYVGYWRWFSNDAGPNPNEDVFRVQVSGDDGSNWADVESVGPSGPETAGGWFFRTFRVADFVTPSALTRLRFVAEDVGGGSIVEAAIDDVVILPFCCQNAASCDDGLSCTTDSCGSSGRCEHASAPGECWIEDACYADGQLNPGNPCEVCDATDPIVWTPALPVEVDGVAVAAGPTILSWSPQAGAVYDVAGGIVLALQTDGGAASAGCLQDDVIGTAWEDTRPDPPLGAGYYYLVRSESSCGQGTWGTGSQGEARQPLLDCP
jgi:DNA-binding beta-propeller fold protein YncE